MIALRREMAEWSRLARAAIKADRVTAGRAFGICDSNRCAAGAAASTAFAGLPTLRIDVNVADNLVDLRLYARSRLGATDRSPADIDALVTAIDERAGRQNRGSAAREHGAGDEHRDRRAAAVS